MTLTRRACGAWPIVGAVIALAAVRMAAFDQLPQPPSSAVAQPRPDGVHVSGRLVAPEGGALHSGAVMLTPIENNGVRAVAPADGRIRPDGTFSFDNVAPGRYRISARADTGNGPLLFATFAVIVEGRDIEGVQMTLQPGATVDGDVTVDPQHATRPPAFSTLRVRAPFADGGGFADALTGTVRADGTFVLRGLMSGDHQIVVEGLPSSWVVTSVVLRGRELVDAGIEVAAGQHLRGARITITDRASEISGRVRNGERPAADAAVLVYPVAPQFWVRTHRRMRLTRTDAEGRFTLRGLPEGEYLAIASGSINEGALGWRELLESIRKLATPVSISRPDARVTIELPFVAVLPGASVQTR